MGGCRRRRRHSALVVAAARGPTALHAPCSRFSHPHASLLHRPTPAPPPAAQAHDELQLGAPDAAAAESLAPAPAPGVIHDGVDVGQQGAVLMGGDWSVDNTRVNGAVVPLGEAGVALHLTLRQGAAFAPLLVGTQGFSYLDSVSLCLTAPTVSNAPLSTMPAITVEGKGRVEGLQRALREPPRRPPLAALPPAPPTNPLQSMSSSTSSSPRAFKWDKHATPAGEQGLAGLNMHQALVPCICLLAARPACMWTLSARLGSGRQEQVSQRRCSFRASVASCIRSGVRAVSGREVKGV